jgi:HK97 family phage portal protein
MPSGVLMGPGRIQDETSRKIKEYWETNFAGSNRGRVAVLGDGLKYEPMTQNAVDSELVAQLELSAKMVCSAYHVPGYKIGIGPTPPQASAEVLNQIYYDDCLQQLIQDAETLLDDGLELPQKGYNAQFNLDDLLKMDSSSQMEFVAKGIEKAVYSPNEGRRRFNLPPVKGGETPFLQQQNWPIDVLAERPPPTDRCW